MARLGLVIAVCFGLAAPWAVAVQPDEILDDPKLEERAREISSEVRCLVCRNEAIDDSNADLARDLRILIRERLEEGDSDAEVRQFLVDRYGEYVLLKPPFSLSNAAIWLSGPVLFLIGLGLAIAFVRRRPATTAAEAPLTAEEAARLDEILRRGDGR